VRKARTTITNSNEGEKPNKTNYHTYTDAINNDQDNHLPNDAGMGGGERVSRNGHLHISYSAGKRGKNTTENKEKQRSWSYSRNIVLIEIPG
jgi:hypothetical protein